MKQGNAAPVDVLEGIVHGLVMLVAESTDLFFYLVAVRTLSLYITI